MAAMLSVLVILAMSILITRIATVALTLTGLSRDVAAFQARSAFTGVGYTTSEAESTVNHPVRRRIVALLMLLGNVGIVTTMSTLIVGFVSVGEAEIDRLQRLAFLLAGVLVLLGLARSSLVDRWLSRVIRWALRRFARLDVRDYAALLHLIEDYEVSQMVVRPDDWLADRSLRDLSVQAEGLRILGIERANGDYVGAPDGDTMILPGDVLLVYGRERAIRRLERRPRGATGDFVHRVAAAEAESVRRDETRH